jgi:hypothetical protein
LMKCPNLAIEYLWGQARIRSLSVDCGCKGKCKGIAPQENAEGVAVQQATAALRSLSPITKRYCVKRQTLCASLTIFIMEAAREYQSLVCNRNTIV